MKGFPGSLAVKNLSASEGDTGSVPGWKRSPGEGNGNLLQYSCLGNSTGRGAWWATVTESDNKMITATPKTQYSVGCDRGKPRFKSRCLCDLGQGTYLSKSPLFFCKMR